MKNKYWQWRNQLIFPLLFSCAFLYAYLQHSLVLLLIGCYFVGHLLYRKSYTLLLLGVMSCCVFLLRAHVSQSASVPIDQAMTVSVQVFPDTIQVNGDYVKFNGTTSFGKVQASYYLHSAEEKLQWQQRYRWNQQLLVQGVIQAPDEQRNLHGFNQRAYLEARQEHLLIVEKIVNKKAGKAYLRQIRARAIDWVERNFPKEIQVYLWALLLGYRDHQFQEIREIYNSSGILHFFTISGMHVYLFYGWLYYLLRRSQIPKQALVLLGVGLWLFSIVLFGQGISVVRAALLYLLNIILKEKQLRLSGMDRFSCVLFLILVWDIRAFQQVSGILSIGISGLLLLKSAENNGIWSNLKYSQALSIFTAPVLSYFFFNYPLLTGILTILCAPFFSIFMLPVSILLCGLKIIHLPIKPLVVILEMGIQILENGLSMFAPIVLKIGRPPLFLVCIAVIVSLLLYQSKWSRFFWFPFCCLILTQQISPLAISFVDVGQGDSIVLQSENNREIFVIDTGGQLSFARESWQERATQSGVNYSLLPFIKGEGITKIDGLFLTHGDADHMGDALSFVQQIPVDWIYVGKGSLNHKSIQRLARQLPKDTKIREVAVGETIGEHVTLQVLAPALEGQGKNEDSLVLTTTIRGQHFLFTGDLDQAGERWLLQQYPQLTIDVLKVGHHGSKTSSDPLFIEQLKIKQAIISCGRNNRFKHPHPEVLATFKQAGVKLYRTDESGMIRFEWYNKQREPVLWLATD